MRKFMQQFNIGLLSLVLLFSVACSGSKTLPAGLNLSELANEVEEKAAFLDEDIMPLNEALFSDYLYQIDQSKLEQWEVRVGGGFFAEEIAFFEAVDEAAAKEIAKIMEERYEFFRNSYANYSPEQLENLKDPVLIQEGNYVFSVISPENSAVKEHIEEYLKKQSS